jgi:hypothetical protein
MAKRSRKSRPPSAAPSARRPMLRLPMLAPPVMRWPRKDPANWGVGASDIGCSACFARCGLLPPPLRSICEDLCAATCAR